MALRSSVEICALRSTSFWPGILSLENFCADSVGARFAASAVVENFAVASGGASSTGDRCCGGGLRAMACLTEPFVGKVGLPGGALAFIGNIPALVGRGGAALVLSSLCSLKPASRSRSCFLHL